MAGTPIARALRAARERQGWSREELAAESGLSWSAIAQIESGRRRKVRLGSLEALADALDVSLDYLAGRRRPRHEPLLEHALLPYDDSDALVEAVRPFVTEGVERGEPALVVTSRRNVRMLTAALGEHAAGVTFADSQQWYRTPLRALRRYEQYLDDNAGGDGASVRVVGEPVWTGRSASDIAAWTRYEAVINLVLADRAATVVCPYDRRTVPEDIVADARRTHPNLLTRGTTTPCPCYAEPEIVLLR